MIPAITNLLGLTHTDPALTALTGLLVDIETSLTHKTITPQEYVDLMIEVDRLKTVIECANDLELRATIHAAIQGLIALAKTAKVL